MCMFHMPNKNASIYQMTDDLECPLQFKRAVLYVSLLFWQGWGNNGNLYGDLTK